jgi:hypothetical protein
MYYEGFKYPSKWTESWDSYLAHRQDICYNIITLMENYEKQIPQIRKQAEDLTQNFFSATNLFANLK